jgi:branched-subunit amino acid transport protein
MSDVLLIFAMTLVTFIPRALPLALASRMHLPARIQQALNYVPIAVLTVIIVQTGFFTQGQLNISVDNPYLWASTAALITALFQKRLFVTILVGLISYSIALYWALV